MTCPMPVHVDSHECRMRSSWTCGSRVEKPSAAMRVARREDLIMMMVSRWRSRRRGNNSKRVDKSTERNPYFKVNMYFDANALKVYVDGSANPNPGRGGIAGIVEYPDELGGHSETAFQIGYERTTNNRMEIRAVIEAFGFISDQQKQGLRFARSAVLTDSMYVFNGVRWWCILPPIVSKLRRRVVDHEVADSRAAVPSLRCERCGRMTRPLMQVRKRRRPRRRLRRD
jgi:ribonuclease HI